MMEILNELNERKRRDIDDFLSFIGIYEDTKREKALKKLLHKEKKYIKGKTCVEAGAGSGIFSIYMAELGAKKVYAVEESKTIFKLLKKNVENFKNIIPINKRIEEFEPDEEIDFLFHEFYGSLLFDESIFSLYELRFKPKRIAPDGGRLWCMFIRDEEILEKDKIYRREWKEILKGALVLDLFPWVKFRNDKKIIGWNYKKDIKKEFIIELKEKADFIGFASEIVHDEESVLKTWEAKNWAIVFTPKVSDKFRLKFSYKGGYTEVKFVWI